MPPATSSADLPRRLGNLPAVTIQRPILSEPGPSCGRSVVHIREERADRLLLHGQDEIERTLTLYAHTTSVLSRGIRRRPATGNASIRRAALTDAG